MSVWHSLTGYYRVLIILGAIYAVIIICRFIGLVLEGKVEDLYHSKIKYDMEAMKRKITLLELKAPKPGA